MSIDDFTGIFGVISGIVLFGFALHQWNDAQQWRRAEKLDAMIKDFDSIPLVVLGRMVLDWTRRTVKYEKTEVKITNTDALLALRVHTELGSNASYTTEQVQIRDALDCTLGFFEQLNIAVSSRLVDAKYARQFFRYWLHKLVTFEAHPVDDPQRQNQEAATGTPAERIAAYITAYGNLDAIVELCRSLGVRVPNELRVAHERMIAARVEPWDD